MPIFSLSPRAPGGRPAFSGQRYGLLLLTLLLLGWRILGAVAGVVSLPVVEKYQGGPAASITANAVFALAYAACLPGLVRRDPKALMAALGLVCTNLLYAWSETLLIHPRPGLPVALLVATILFVFYASFVLPRLLRYSRASFRIE